MILTLLGLFLVQSEGFAQTSIPLPGDQSRVILQQLREIGAQCNEPQLSVGLTSAYDPDTGKWQDHLSVSWDHRAGGCVYRIQNIRFYRALGDAFLVVEYHDFDEKTGTAYRTKVLNTKESSAAAAVAKWLEQYAQKTIEKAQSNSSVSIEVWKAKSLDCGYAVVPNARVSCRLVLQDSSQKRSQK